ncbi:MAG: hypothetical protein Q8L60_10830 [Gammaproteobacteria bacterium]|nr:hypothetical protein [Gammaproteobacteria bacterium]MDP2346842.1 hypothetical protein [Gammaproteobacteria bacterium]
MNQITEGAPLNLTQILHDLYQNGQITILADGTASWTMLALMTVAKVAEQTPAFAIVRHIHEKAECERQSRESMKTGKPDFCGDLKAALRLH